MSMKKTVVFLLTLILAIGLVGCVADKEQPPEKTVAGVPPFSLPDINNQTVTSGVFKNYKLTVVNIWATGCRYCVDEMPDLETLYQQMKSQNINVLGIVVDGQQNQALARDILRQSDVTFSNIMPDEKFIETFVAEVAGGVPTTLFVNSSGEIVGDIVAGARSKEQYVKLIEERLK